MKTQIKRAHSDRIYLRATPRQKRLIVAVARRNHVGVTDFVLQAAVARAEEALAEQTEFVVSPSRWEAFQKALERPPQASAGLKRLLREPGVLDVR